MGIYAFTDCDSVVIPVAGRYRVTKSGFEKVAVITEEVGADKIAQLIKELIDDEQRKGV